MRDARAYEQTGDRCLVVVTTDVFGLFVFVLPGTVGACPRVDHTDHTDHTDHHGNIAAV